MRDGMDLGNVMTAAKLKAPEETRRKILNAAFDEFYTNGFQGGSLNHIVKTAGITKGALFHHFAGKRELAFAVIDELIEPIMKRRWLDPLAGSTNPVADIARCVRQYAAEDIKSGSWVKGCPLNNLAQEMSPLDEGFRKRINALYDAWRSGIAAALALGAKAGKVKKQVAAEEVAALIVAAQMGIWGSGKSSRDRALMTEAAEALCGFLETLEA